LPFSAGVPGGLLCTGKPSELAAFLCVAPCRASTAGAAAWAEYTPEDDAERWASMGVARPGVALVGVGVGATMPGGAGAARLGEAGGEGGAGMVVMMVSSEAFLESEVESSWMREGGELPAREGNLFSGTRGGEASGAVTTRWRRLVEKEVGTCSMGESFGDRRPATIVLRRRGPGMSAPAVDGRGGSSLERDAEIVDGTDVGAGLGSGWKAFCGRGGVGPAYTFASRRGTDGECWSFFILKPAMRSSYRRSESRS